MSHLGNETTVVNVTAGQQDIEACEVPMQNVHAVQVGHPTGNLPGCSQNRHQVWQAVNSRPVGAEPASVNPILSACTTTSARKENFCEAAYCEPVDLEAALGEYH